MRSFTRIFSIILLMVWMGFIFYLSDQPAEVSSKVSGEVIEVIAEKFYPDFENMSEVEKADIVASFQFAARKSAHVAGFALLGFLSFFSIVTYTRIRFFWRLFIASALALVYAASDEYHQRFVPGRSCELRDFLLDAAGIIGAILLCFAFVQCIGPLRRRAAFKRKDKPQAIPAIKAFDSEAVQPTEETAQNIEIEPLVTQEIPKVEAAPEVVQISQCQAEEKNYETEQPQTEEATLSQVESAVPKTESKESMMKQKSEIKLSSEIEYAASVIGEAVIEVTKVCNKIAANGSENTKELVNLALGRNEVLKSEILQILTLEISFEQKQNLIQSEKTKAYDYFNSILAQMC